jgi:hypothetical protein
MERIPGGARDACGRGRASLRGGLGAGVKTGARSWGALVLGVLAVLTGILASVLSASQAQAATATFTFGQLRTDTSGKPLQMHGLGVLKVGSTWYAIGEDKTGENAFDTSFQNIPCYSSTDLSSWTYQGAALTRQANGDLGPKRIVERPKLMYNASTSTYVMYMHIDAPNYQDAKVGVATSSEPCGPYTYRGSFRPLGHPSRDIGVFQESDGTAYLMSEDMSAGLRIYRLSADYLSVTGEVALLEHLESPAMIKVDGVYYLLASHLTGWNPNDNVYATATSLGGPWSSFETLADPGTRTYDSQTANIITVQGSVGTTHVYAGDRWNTDDMEKSLLIWLPLTIRGRTVHLDQYPTWSLDVAAGTWSTGSTGSAGPAGSTGSGLPADGIHRLTNAGSQLVMDVDAESRADGGKVIQWPHHGRANQQWALTRVRDNLYTLTNVNSGLCLDVPDGGTSHGSPLQQSKCTGEADQLWAIDSAGDSTYVLVNKRSGLTIGTADGGGQGAAVVQQNDSGAPEQRWTM